MRRASAAIGTAAIAALVTSALAPASPAAANHVLQPACDSVRRDLIAANSAHRDANDVFLPARDLVDQALANVAAARQQLVAPVVNYVGALENEVGVGPAREGFEGSLRVFTDAVALYLERLEALVPLQAARELQGQVVQLLEAVRQGLEARIPCPAVPLVLVIPL